MKTLLSLFLACALIACGETKTSDTDSVKNDSVASAGPATPVAETLGGDTIEPKDASVILFRFDKKLADMQTKELTVKEVRQRFWPVSSSCEQAPAYTLKRFFELDSLYKATAEPNFDLGQTVQVNVRLVDTLDVSPEFTTVAWTMYYATYEACPYSSGTYYMVSTYAKDGKLLDTQMLGESTGGADAPVWSHSTENTNLFRDGSFKSFHVDTAGEDSDEGKATYEITKAVYRGAIGKDGKIVRTKINS